MNSSRRGKSFFLKSLSSPFSTCPRFLFYFNHFSYSSFSSVSIVAFIFSCLFFTPYPKRVIQRAYIPVMPVATIILRSKRVR